jgi:hypothetical protein
LFIYPSQFKTEIGKILTLDANRALSVGSMALEATANAFFLLEKKSAKQIEIFNCSKSYVFAILRESLKGSLSKKCSFRLALHKVATEAH